MKIKIAKAVYCPGVDTWYVRIGSQCGVDPMFKSYNKKHAEVDAELINTALNIELKRRRHLGREVRRRMKK